MCESCANGTDWTGVCNVCGRMCGSQSLYYYPDPGWCMTPEEEYGSRVERGFPIPDELLDQMD